MHLLALRHEHLSLRLFLLLLFTLLRELFKGPQKVNLTAFTLLRYWLWACFEKMKGSSLMFYSWETKLRQLPMASNYSNDHKYLHEMNGISLSAFHQSSEISIVSLALAIPFPELRCSFAFLTSYCKYSPWNVLSTLKKYSRSGTLPLAIFEGKYLMNCSSVWIIGQSLTTANSS